MTLPPASLLVLLVETHFFFLCLPSSVKGVRFFFSNYAIKTIYVIVCITKASERRLQTSHNDHRCITAQHKQSNGHLVYSSPIGLSALTVTARFYI